MKRPSRKAPPSESSKARFPDRSKEALEDWHRQRPDLDSSVQNIRARVLLIGSYLTRDNDRIALRYGVTGHEMRVLFALRRIGKPYEMRPTDLFKSLLVPSGTMTRQLSHLDRLALIKRTDDTEDRRGYKIRLTAKGRATADAALTEAVMASAISSALNRLSPSERKTLSGLLKQILGNLENVEILQPR